MLRKQYRNTSKELGVVQVWQLSFPVRAFLSACGGKVTLLCPPPPSVAEHTPDRVIRDSREVSGRPACELQHSNSALGLASSGSELCHLPHPQASVTRSALSFCLILVDLLGFLFIKVIFWPQVWYMFSLPCEYVNEWSLLNNCSCRIILYVMYIRRVYFVPFLNKKLYMNTCLPKLLWNFKKITSIGEVSRIVCPACRRV